MHLHLDSDAPSTPNTDHEQRGVENAWPTIRLKIRTIPVPSVLTRRLNPSLCLSGNSCSPVETALL
jgi:hypothetical protein